MMPENNKLPSNSHPGPQVKIFNFSWIIFILLCFTVLFLLLSVYCLVKDNLDTNNRYYHYFTLNIFDSKTCCAAFMSLVGLLIVRYHFVIGYRPILVYESAKTKSAAHPNFANQIVWQVKIKNVGPGPAVFSNLKFRIHEGSPAFENYKLSFDDVDRELEKRGFVSERDFFLTIISKGAAFPNKEQLTIFELRLPANNPFPSIDMQIKFKGLVGGTYQKEIYLLPRKGIGAFNMGAPEPTAVNSVSSESKTISTDEEVKGLA